AAALLRFHISRLALVFAVPDLVLLLVARVARWIVVSAIFSSMDRSIFHRRSDLERHRRIEKLSISPALTTILPRRPSKGAIAKRKRHDRICPSFRVSGNRTLQSLGKDG